MWSNLSRLASDSFVCKYTMRAYSCLRSKFSSANSRIFYVLRLFYRNLLTLSFITLYATEYSDRLVLCKILVCVLKNKRNGESIPFIVYNLDDYVSALLMGRACADRVPFAVVQTCNIVWLVQWRQTGRLVEIFVYCSSLLKWMGVDLLWWKCVPLSMVFLFIPAATCRLQSVEWSVDCTIVRVYGKQLVSCC
jgi:hypothetical protein